jgi:hypothetical protein
MELLLGSLPVSNSRTFDTFCAEPNAIFGGNLSGDNLSRKSNESNLSRNEAIIEKRPNRNAPVEWEVILASELEPYENVKRKGMCCI